MTVSRLSDTIRLLPLLILLITPMATEARKYTANPADYRLQLKKLQAGDQLLLSPGIYTQGLPIHHFKGQPDAPIVITGPAEGQRAIFIGRSGHNTISIIDSHHVTMRYLQLDGRSLPVDGVKCEGHATWAHHITLEHLLIERHDYNQQIVAISTKCPAWNWTIRHNIIRNAGTGLYLGNSDGSAPFIAGLIEHNLVIDTLGYNLQIKHQRERPVIDGMPQQNAVTLIRHNVFAKASQNRDPAMARPNVLLGHWPLDGSGKNDRYLVYGNFFYENTQEALFQGEGNIALYNNLLVNHHGNGMHIQPHHDIPREIHIFFNTVLANGAGIHYTSGNRSESIRPVITSNLIFAQPASVITRGSTCNNFEGTYSHADKFLANPFAPPGQLDLSPLPAEQSEISVGQNSPYKGLQNFSHGQFDFDGNISIHRMGAYAHGKPVKWSPQLTVKPDMTHPSRSEGSNRPEPSLTR